MKLIRILGRNETIAVIVGLLFVAAAVVAVNRIEQRGYDRAAAKYEARILEMTQANMRAIESARIGLEAETTQLQTQLAETETKLQEILNDDAQYDDGCGAPLRAIRLLDQIR